MSLESVARRIAAKTSFKELAAVRALGYDPIDAYVKCWQVLDETYAAAFKPEQRYVWQEPKMICNRGPR